MGEIEKPYRVQLSRKAGWRMPPNTIKVTRPGKWGNPFKVDAQNDATAAVRDFRLYVEGLLRNGTGYPLAELRGKNLACWCRLGEPCHADVLIELANAPVFNPTKL